MRTSMKVILAAMSAAVLASPVMAQNWQSPYAPVRPDLSTDNVFWGEVPVAPHGYGYGSAARGQAGWVAPGGVTIDGHPRILDCVHVPFPQCSGGGN
jgi:opacity protein-like surface antigen